MEFLFHPEVAQRVAEGRNSFAGRSLTDRQYADFVAVVGMMARRIEETGSFIDPLNDYANAMARTERFDSVTAATKIRELFTQINGMTMNAMRESLLENEAKLFDREKNPAERERLKAHQAGVQAGRMVETGDKITFFRALNFESVQLATELKITHLGARRFIEENFEEIEGRKLEQWGVELDEKYYHPQIEAAKAERKAQKSQPRAHQPSYS